MIQGTASSVGKSILVTALCRIFKQDGFSVAPFKAQNMALNSFVTRQGGEIGRSQVVQAEAAGIEPTVDMNPVLLKPEADARSQVIVRGKLLKTISAGEYYKYTPYLLKTVGSSLSYLRSIYEMVIIEGAGSPAEINLKEREIVNMRVAGMAGAPVLLVGDIDRGGVFASLVGTLELLDEGERNYIKGFIINKFRGDLRLLQPGLKLLEKRTSKPVLGVIPYFRNITIAQEDSVYLDERQNSPLSSDLDIAIIRLPHISNYDDFDPLEEEGCRGRYVACPAELGTPDLIILPGTKSTIGDLAHLRQSGLAESIIQQAREGKAVIGICGGYQMLGKSLHDPEGIESTEKSVLGLGLLDVVTTFISQKSTTQVKARVLTDRGLLEGMKGQELVGYEIHMGQTGNKQSAGAFSIVETPEGKADYLDGTLDTQGMVLGTYMHGLFHNPGFRRNLLNSLRRRCGLPEREHGTAAGKETQYDKLAELVRQNLDMAAIYDIVNQGIGN
ncbi:MAG: cobyric acid synthase [Dehalococcoidales bacterium]|nr:cobyric acid synthase [Dehalococcoidales bacterium]